MGYPQQKNVFQTIEKPSSPSPSPRTPRTPANDNKPRPKPANDNRPRVPKSYYSTPTRRFEAKTVAKFGLRTALRVSPAIGIAIGILDIAEWYLNGDPNAQGDYDFTGWDLCWTNADKGTSKRVVVGKGGCAAFGQSQTFLMWTNNLSGQAYGEELNIADDQNRITVLQYSHPINNDIEVWTGYKNYERTTTGELTLSPEAPFVLTPYWDTVPAPEPLPFHLQPKRPQTPFYESGPSPSPTPAPQPFTPRGPTGPNEKKFKSNFMKGLTLALRIFHGASEVMDYMEVFLKSIKGLKRKDWEKLDPVDRMALILNNLDNIDWVLAQENFVKNEIEDKIIGKTMSKLRSKTTPIQQRAYWLLTQMSQMDTP